MLLPCPDRQAARQRRRIQEEVALLKKQSTKHNVPDPSQPEVWHRVSHEEEVAKKKLQALKQAVEEQEALLESVRLQKQVVAPILPPGRNEARALEKIMRKLPAVAAGRTVDLSTVFGNKLHSRGQQAWGDAWTSSIGGRPPIRDVFRVSPEDMVDLRNYFRQLIRNADTGQKMPPALDTTTDVIPPASHLMDSSSSKESKLDGRPSFVPRLRLQSAAPSHRAPFAPQSYLDSEHSAAVPRLPSLPASSDDSDSDSHAQSADLL